MIILLIDVVFYVLVTALEVSSLETGDLLPCQCSPDGATVLYPLNDFFEIALDTTGAPIMTIEFFSGATLK